MEHGAEQYRRYLAGDDDGIVELIKEYKDGLILFLNRYVSNIYVAEELAEETFFGLITKRPKFREKYAFKTWLYTIGRNIAINHLRQAGRFTDISVETENFPMQAVCSLEQAYMQKEEKILIHRALDKLPKDYATVLYLKFLEDMKNEEIAGVLKKSRRQVENLLYQAKRALKEELSKEGFEYEKL